MKETYFSMHNHSQFSFQDGYASPKEYLDRAKEIGLKGFAITEHGNQCSWVYFDELKKQYPEVKMVYGVEFYEALDGNVKDSDNRYYHLLAIAINEEGRKALNWLVSESQKYFYFKPRVDLNLFRRCFELFSSESIVVASACLQSKLSREKDFKKCVEYIKEYKEVFPYFYLEMQSHSHQDQSDYNQKILMLATTTHTPYIITTDSHASTKEDLYYQARHVQIAHDSETMSESYEGCYLQTVEEIHEIMDGQIGEEAVDKGLRETLKILKLCDNVDMPWQSPQLPDFPIPDGFEDEEDYIRHLIFDIGWKERKCDELSIDEQTIYKQRLEYELNVIKEMGFIGYFLIVWEFIHWAKNNGVEVGVGRGCQNFNSLIWCKDSIKPIGLVKIGDEVLSADGEFHKVLKTFEYDIEEPMIEFEYQRQGNSRKKYPTKLTVEHKILVHRNNKNIYIQAQDVKVGDLLCSPKIKHTNNEVLKFDLNDYNIYGYEYDDEYIYEKVMSQKAYKYSITDLENKGLNRVFMSNIVNNRIDVNTRNKNTQKNISKFFEITPFKSFEEYREYFQENRFVIRKIKRFVTIDKKWNILFGLLYGDGAIRNKDYKSISLAVNKTNFKNDINKQIFCDCMNELNLSINIVNSKERNLIQYEAYSHIVSNWLSDLLFESKLKKDKILNPILLNQSHANLLALKKGLFDSDGSKHKDGHKHCFDNTSLSLITTFKYLHNIENKEPLALDVRLAYQDDRGYNSKESYKVRWLENRSMYKINSDDDYWYLPVTKIIKHDLCKEKVYDLMVADNPSFVVNNVVTHNSGAGSLTNYLLGICNLDPIPYDLIFERFLNPERVSLPDIDTDFNDRKPVVKHMQEKYGYDKVAQVINYSYITNVVAIKDAGRLLKLPYSVVQQISKRFNYDTWEECMEHNPNILEEYPEYYDLFDIASHLSGRVRQASTHAGGVVVSQTVLSDYMGCVRGLEEEMVVQADKRYCEPIGLIKFDLLAVSTLNILKGCQETAGISEWEINPNNPKFLEDSATFDLIGTGRTNAVFQIESAGMKDLVKRIKPRTIQELSHIIALYRPDSMPMLEDYVARVTGQAPIEYWCPEVEPILKSTCGCLIYQEQTMQIVKDLGNRTYGGADRMRKCLAKKNPAKVKEETDLLRKEMAEQHHSQETIDTICSYLEKMGNYSFNKSHSMAYAVLAMQTAYLKAHYPLHFFNALLKLNEEDYSNINKYILDAKSFGVEVIQPNINQSDKSFRIYQDKIMFGLLPIVGVGDKLATAIIEERETNGKFKGMQDFISRVKVTQAQVVNLIKSGALPTKNKKESLINYAKSLFNASEFKPVSTLPTLKTLKEKFGIDTDVIKDKEERLRLYNNIKKIEFNKAQQEKFEKHMNTFYDKYLQNEDFWQFETLSIFIDSNPFDEAYEYLTPLSEVECGTKCVMAGVIANVQKKKDRYKNDFAFLNIYSSYGITEVTCWSGQFKKYDILIKRGSQVTILCDKQEDGSYFVREMKPYQEWLQFMKNKRKVVRR